MSEQYDLFAGLSQEELDDIGITADAHTEWGTPPEPATAADVAAFATATGLPMSMLIEDEPLPMPVDVEGGPAPDSPLLVDPPPEGHTPTDAELESMGFVREPPSPDSDELEGRPTGL
jgi:hypothetical protein